jgi:micrococcal nuclease
LYTYAAKLKRVIDGDTVVLDLDLGFYQWRLDRSYRLSRIDAPEMGTAEGVAAKEHLMLLTAEVASFMVTTAKADSFDRWIIELFADGRNLNDQMVTDGFATYRVYR